MTQTNGFVLLNRVEKYVNVNMRVGYIIYHRYRSLYPLSCPTKTLPDQAEGKRSRSQQVSDRRICDLLNGIHKYGIICI